MYEFKRRKEMMKVLTKHNNQMLVALFGGCRHRFQFECKENNNNNNNSNRENDGNNNNNDNQINEKQDYENEQNWNMIDDSMDKDDDKNNHNLNSSLFYISNHQLDTLLHHGGSVHCVTDIVSRCVHKFVNLRKHHKQLLQKKQKQNVSSTESSPHHRLRSLPQFLFSDFHALCLYVKQKALATMGESPQNYAYQRRKSPRKYKVPASIISSKHALIIANSKHASNSTSHRSVVVCREAIHHNQKTDLGPHGPVGYANLLNQYSLM
jgi:hypothetical protein